MILFVLASMTAPLALGEQQVASPPLVSTTGSAQILVVPDLADLSFEVEVRNADLVTARRQQADRSIKLLTVLRSAGIAEAELQSSQVQISPDYTNRGEETERIKFYRVTQNISCTLHDVKKLSDITALAVTAGASGVREACLRTSELRKYRDEARSKAIRAAKEKAVALATELGSKVGKPYAITESPIYDASYGNGNTNLTQTRGVAQDPPEDPATPSFAPGSIAISAAVSVSFLLE